MFFNSFEFLLFLPVMVIGYYTLPFKYRWFWLLLGSYYFYMAHEPELVILLLVSTVVDYLCGLQIAKATSYKRKKVYLIISIFTNVGILVVFKYLSFITTTIESALRFFHLHGTNTSDSQSYDFNQILLPIGISFYTFQTLSYTIDVYRGKVVPEKHLGKFALYVAFFPQLVAGPIERAQRLLPQLKKKVLPHPENLKKGLIMIAWGFFLKIVVADRLGVYVDEAYSDPENHHGLPLLLSAFFFGFQIYYDFSAYTSIALGTAKTMGIDLMQNFNRPFFSTSSTQFWKRWHISLMRWMLDYLYQPLVKKAHLSRLTAVMIVFFINGLWHGANWTFVIWSILNALLLVVEVATNKLRKKVIKVLRLPKLVVNSIGWAIVMGYLMTSLIFFRAPSFEEAIIYLTQMVKISNLHINILGNYLELVLCFIFIFFAQTVHFYKGNNRIHELLNQRPRYFRWTIYVGYVLIIAFFAINRQNTFIYFQF